MIKYIKARLAEKSSHAGIAMVAGGVALLLLGPYTHWIAFGAIAYGAYNLLTKG